MKKKIIINVTISLFFIVGCFIVFMMLNNEDNDTNEPIKLEAPVVILENDLAQWESNEKAKMFEVKIGDNSLFLNNKVTQKVLENGDSFKIRAIGDNKMYSDSDWSNIVTYIVDEVVNTYTVTWQNGDEILEIDYDVVEGTIPMYNGIVPTKTSDENGEYIFNGWSTTVSAVTGDIIYYAEFITVDNDYSVFFYDDDGTTLLGVSIVKYGQTAVYPNDTPVKESTKNVIYTFEKWVSNLEGDEEANLTNITSNIEVYAKYVSQDVKFKVVFYDFDNNVISEQLVIYGESAKEPELPSKDGYIFDSWNVSFDNVKSKLNIYPVFIPVYNVIFYDWDDSVLSEQIIKHGESAETPTEPFREGYRFDSWDATFDNVREDLVVYPVYIRQYTVKFIDYDDSIISLQLIDDGDKVKTPEDPSRKNYVFIGWDTDFDNIESDLTIRAQYIRQYTVEFINYDGTVLKTEIVNSGNSATAPTNDEIPSREGYELVSWSQSFDNVTSNLKIQAIYKIKSYMVQFLDFNGKVIYSKEVLHGSTVIAPEMDEIYFDWSTTTGYKFLGWLDWDESQTIGDDITIRPNYSQRITEPLIAIETNNISKGETAVEVGMYLCCSNIDIYGLNLNLELPNNSVLTTDSIVINSKFNGAESFLDTDNNKFSLSWVQNNGIAINGRVEILKFKFNIDKYADAGEYIINVLNDTFFINKSLTKVTPIIIVGGIIIE